MKDTNREPELHAGTCVSERLQLSGKPPKIRLTERLISPEMHSSSIYCCFSAAGTANTYKIARCVAGCAFMFGKICICTPRA